MVRGIRRDFNAASAGSRLACALFKDRGLERSESPAIKPGMPADKIAGWRTPDRHLSGRHPIQLQIAVSIKSGAFAVGKGGLGNVFVSKKQREQPRLNRIAIGRIDKPILNLVFKMDDSAWRSVEVIPNALHDFAAHEILQTLRTLQDGSL